MTQDACQGEAGTHIEYSAEAEEALDKELAELRRNLALVLLYSLSP